MTISPRNLPPALLLVAAWLLPGLGHFLAGMRSRGIILAVAILGLFTAGLLIGGIDAVDRRNNTGWFALGQIHVGPTAIIVSELHAHLDDTTGHDPVPTDAAYRPSIARVNELGTLYCAVAGGLNILVMLDLLGKLTAAAPAPDPSQHGRLVTRDTN